MDEYERFHYQCAIGHSDLVIIKKDRNMCCKYKNVESNFPSKGVSLGNWTISLKLLQGGLSSQCEIYYDMYIYLSFLSVQNCNYFHTPIEGSNPRWNIQLICIQYLSCHLHFSNPFSKFIINDWDDLILYFLMLELITQTRCLWIMCI